MLCTYLWTGFDPQLPWDEIRLYMCKWVLNSKHFNLECYNSFNIRCAMAVLAACAQCPSKPADWVCMQTCSLCSDCPRLIRLWATENRKIPPFHVGSVLFCRAARALPLSSWERQWKVSNTAGLFIPSIVLDQHVSKHPAERRTPVLCRYEASPCIDIRWVAVHLYSVRQPYAIPTHLTLYLESRGEILKVFETCWEKHNTRLWCY